MKRFLPWRSTKPLVSTQQSVKYNEIPSLILLLPVEILELIVSNLEYDFGLAFSLTCKYTYNTFFHSIQSSTPYHPRNSPKLLRLLDRDTTEYLLCQYHYKFYAWRCQVKNEYRCPDCQEPPYSTTSIALCGQRCKVPASRYVNNETCRLLLRYASHGSSSGVPPSKYNHLCPTVGGGNNQVEIKVVDQKLMIRRKLRVMVTKKNLLLDKNSLSLCLHGTPGYHGIALAATEHISTARRDVSSKPTQWSCPLLFKCKDCATDMKLNIIQSTRKTAAIGFDVYHDLGGVDERTIAQSQVLYAMSQIQALRTTMQTRRLREDLSRQFHTLTEYKTAIEDTQERTFIDQWDTSVKHDRWACNFDDATKVMPIWVRYSKLPFTLQGRGLN